MQSSAGQYKQYCCNLDAVRVHLKLNVCHYREKLFIEFEAILQNKELHKTNTQNSKFWSFCEGKSFLAFVQHLVLPIKK
jgi:hypothetical protein